MRNSLCLILVFSVLLSFSQTRDYLFVPNENQWESQVNYRAEIQGGALFLENQYLTYHFIDEAAFLHSHAHEEEKPERLKHHSFQIHFDHSNPNSLITPSHKKAEVFNYFIGENPNHWASNIHPYSQIQYSSLYPGIDLKIYTNQQQLKYDFIVQKNANPDLIQMTYNGEVELSISNQQLHIKTSVNEMVEEAPYVYQVIDGQEIQVPCFFSLDKQTVSFDFPNGYNKEHDLIIDPSLIFSTYSGSFANNFGYTATFDSDGNLYAGGSAFGVGYPTTIGAYDVDFNGGNSDIGITKYASDGTSRIYSTYLGGGFDDLPHSFIVNSANELCIYGSTSSDDFPITAGAFDNTFEGGAPLDLSNGLGVNYVNGSDMIVAKLSSSGGALLASTYLGGSENDGLNSTPELRYNYADEVRGEIMIDQNDDIYIVSCTQSSDYPIVGNPIQANNAGSQDGCISKLNPDLTSVLWSTYLGGNENDAIYSIAIDENNDILVSGGTVSTDFPTTLGVLNPAYLGGRSDGFISIISSDGQTLMKSTFFGTAEYDQSYFVELDEFNNVYLYGQTETTSSELIVNAAYNVPNSGQFISKLNPDLTAYVWSTTFGTGDNTINISPTAFLVDYCNKIYLSGWGGNVNRLSFLNNSASFTTGLPTTPDAYQSTTDGSDFYLMVISDDASSLEYGSFFGGGISSEHVDGGTSRFDRKGRVYQSVCAGCGGNSDFPFYPDPGGISQDNNSSCNNGVFKFDFDVPVVVADFSLPQIICSSNEITIENSSLDQGATDYLWEFHDGSTSSDFEPSFIYYDPGTYEIILTITDSTSCNISDTLIQEITIREDSIQSLGNLPLCEGTPSQIGIEAYTDHEFTYTWIPSTGLSDSTISDPISDISDTTDYTLVISNDYCVDTFFQTVVPSFLTLDITNDTSSCDPNTNFLLEASGDGNIDSYLWSSQEDFFDTLNIFPSSSSVQVNLFEGSNEFYIQTIDEYGCIRTDTTSVFLNSGGVSYDYSTSYCYGDTIVMSASSLFPDDSVTFHWANYPMVSDTVGSEISVNSHPGFNQVYTEALFFDGCLSYDTLAFYYSPIDPSNLSSSSTNDTILLGESLQLNVEPNGMTYTWTPSNYLSDASIPNPIASPEETITYTVDISDPNDPNCSKTVEITIYVVDFTCEEPNIYVPNTFTPNYDNENDVVYVRGKNVEKMYFAIYDRWGELIFHTTYQNQGWDGTYQGKELDPDVYVYYLEVTCIGGIDYFKKGNITLLR